MWYSKQLRRLRKARQALKGQQQALADLELEGFVALTIHSLTRSITVPVEASVVAQAVDLLREEIRSRRRSFKIDARQLRRNWREHDILHPDPKLTEDE